MNLDGRTLAEATGGLLLRDGPAGPVLTDTRKLVPGAWFVALRGPNFDGHDYVEVAAQAGAAGVVVSQPVADFPGGIVRVDDTTEAYGLAGLFARRQLTVPVVGITGSSGKTTTRALVALALSPLGVVHQTVANLNNHLGVPMTLLATPPDADAVVVEMGTSGPGEIRYLADIAEPSHRMIVNVGPAHLQELGGLDGVAVEKGAMFDTASAGDTLLVNLDDPRLRMRRGGPGIRTVTYGRDPASEVRLVDVQLDPDAMCTRLRVHAPQGLIEARVTAFGLHVAHNATAALAVAWSLGVDLEAAALALERYEPVGMRQRVELLPSGGRLLNDAYNANPDSTRVALDTLAALGGTPLAALGDMLELGPTEVALHREVLEHALKLGIRLYVVGPRMAQAAAGLGIACFETPEAATEALRGELVATSRLLVKGSRGMHMERIVHQLLGTHPEGH